jgi:hypothetical protein
MKIRSILLSLLMLTVLLITTQCSANTTTNPPATPTNLPATPTNPPATPTNPPVAPTNHPATPTIPPAVPAITNTPSSSTELDGGALVQARCTVCHSTDRIQRAAKSADEWKTTVERMIGHGASLNADEEAGVIKYLAATYPK